MKKSEIKKGNFSDEDYEWVSKQLSYSAPSGVSPKELAKISLKESKNLGMRPRNEKPPGRDKISQIIRAGIGIDWSYQKSKGGRGHRSLLLPKQIDPVVNLEKSVNLLAFSELILTIKKLKKQNRFSGSDYFEFVRVRNVLLSYPMLVYYGKVEKGLNKDVMFNSIVSSVKEQIQVLKKIEKYQTSLYKNFHEIIKNIDRLVDSNLIQATILGASDADKSYKAASNALKRLIR